MITVHTRVAAELPARSCQLLLQIHDELLFEVDEGLVVQVGESQNLGGQPRHWPTETEMVWEAAICSKQLQVAK